VITVERVRGAEVESNLDALARLRMEVFREFPYLYVGTPENEQQYLRGYLESPRSTLVIARDGEQIVGVSSAIPLLDHTDAELMAPAFREVGYDPGETYYFGESVLSRTHRRRGIGHAFFDQREAAARELGFARSAFCAVQRAPDHPARPADYVAHDAFWTRRGYVRRADLVARFGWCDLGDSEESEKVMIFWLKELCV